MLKLVGAVMCLFVVGAGCSGRTSSNGSGELEASISPLTVQPAVTFSVSIQTPKSVLPTSVTLGATGSMVIGAGAIITRPGSALSVVTNTGSGGIDAEPTARLGDVWSTSTVTLRDRVHVLGRIRAPAVIPGSNDLIDGGIDTAAVLTPKVVTTWSVTYPAATAPDVIVNVNSTGSAAPGRYGTLRVFGGGKLSLSTGTYFVDNLDLESTSKVILNQDAGPVLIYVRLSTILRGVVSTTTNSPPDLLLGWLGTADLFVEAAFSGAIVAPSAKVVLRSVTGGQSGAFFGKDVAVDAGATVTFRPPNVIITAQQPSRNVCVSEVLPNDTLSGAARDVQYQRDLLRFCTGTDLPSCELTLRARLNVDFFAAAAALFSNRMSSGTYAQLVQDRDKLIRTFHTNGTLACQVVAGDGDGDYVPNGSDSCPTTPPLTPVLANGCTNTAIPTGPPITEVQSILKQIGVTVDPRCAGAPIPSIPAPIGAWRFPSDPSVGKAVWISRDTTQSTCPLFYQVEVVLTDGMGVRAVAFRDTDDVVLPWITRPAGAVQFNIHTTDAGNKGAWASYAVHTRSYRARAINSAGKRSDWSEYFSAGNEDCVVGQPCVNQ